MPESNPLDEFNALDLEAQSLRDKLLEIEKKKEEKKREIERLSPVNIKFTSYSQYGRYFYFHVSPVSTKQEFIKELGQSGLARREYSDSINIEKDEENWSVSIHNIATFIKWMEEKGDRIKRTCTNKDLLALLDECKQPWNYTVSFHPNKAEPIILIKHNLRINIEGKFLKIPGVKYFEEKRTLQVPKAEAWRSYAILFELRNVQYEDGVREFIYNQLKRREELETIKTKESYPPYLELDFNGHKLKPYQSVGVRFGILGEGRFLIGDEMGLGKSLQAIAYGEIKAKEDYPEDPSQFKKLIVCPARLIPNWYRAIRKFTGKDTRIKVYRGNTPTKFELESFIKKDYDYAIIGFNQIGKEHKLGASEKINKDGYKVLEDESKENLWVTMINLAKFDLIIFDEAHYMANFSSGMSKGGRKMESKYVAELTGTPIVNRPPELWPLLNIINKNQFPDRTLFIRQYTYDGKTPNNVKQLHELISPVFIMRKHREVQKDLAPIERIPHYITLPPKARKVYDKALVGILTYIDSLGNEWEREIPNILVKLNRLKQISAYAKVPETSDLAWELYTANEETEHPKVLIGSFWKETTFGIAGKLGMERSLSFVDRTSGGNLNTIAVEKRYDRIDEFTKNKDIYFLTTPFMSAQEGMDITAAGNVICNDMWWNPKVHLQYEGRAYGRIVDSHSITSYYVIAENTIDEDIWSLVWHEKSGMIKEMLESGGSADPSQSIAKKLIQTLKDQAERLREEGK